MTKQELHQALLDTETETLIPVDNFISIYGNDDNREIQKQMTKRADILAKTYNLSVTLLNNEYRFTR